MRKVAFVNIVDDTRKLMIYESTDGVYLFGYDCIQDAPSNWESWFKDLETANNYCQDSYRINEADWIQISDPCQNCQHDFIMPTRIKGSDTGNPIYGKYETRINARWVEISYNKLHSFSGLTGNERLFATGLINEFDNAKINDESKAAHILRILHVC